MEEVSKYILLLQNLVIYVLMGHMTFYACKGIVHAHSGGFRRIMGGILALAVSVIFGMSSITLTLLSERLPTIGEFLFVEVFIFLQLYVWYALNPRDLNETLEK